jgi:hypothetical protein
MHCRAGERLNAYVSLLTRRDRAAEHAPPAAVGSNNNLLGHCDVSRHGKDDGSLDERQQSVERRHSARCRRRFVPSDGSGGYARDADDFAVAVLDFSLGSHSATPLARCLARRNVPFILHTGMSRSEPSLMEWRDFPIVEKPASPHTLVAAIKSVLAREPARSQGRR